MTGSNRGLYYSHCTITVYGVSERSTVIGLKTEIRTILRKALADCNVVWD